MCRSISTLFGGGQLAWIGLCIFALLGIALAKEQYFLAGLILSMGYYKPPLFLVAAAYLSLRTGFVSFLIGELIGMVLLTWLTLLISGIKGLLLYITTVSRYTYGQELYENFSITPDIGTGLFALLTTFFSANSIHLVIYTLLVLLILLFALTLNHRQRHFDAMEYAFVIVVSVALSLQCIKYDLAILLVAFSCIAAARHSVNEISKYLIYSAVVGFYFEFLGRKLAVLGTTLNISPLFFIILLIGLASAVLGSDTPEDRTMPLFRAA